jgi:hypothetical protein
MRPHSAGGSVTIARRAWTRSSGVSAAIRVVPYSMPVTGARSSTRSPSSSATRCEICCAPPTNRRSGPGSARATNGVSGSPDRAQKSAASSDVRVVAAIGPTFAASHSCSEVWSHSAASGACQGASSGTLRAIVMSFCEACRTAAAAPSSHGRNGPAVS